MMTQKINYSKNSQYQSNLSTPSKFSKYLKEKSEEYGSLNKIGGDDLFNGEICFPNLSKKIKNLDCFNNENPTTRAKTNETLFQEKNALDNSNYASEEKSIKNFIGKKINNTEAKKAKKKKKMKKISKASEQNSQKLNEENKDNSIKAAIKAPFIFFILLINEIGNIKLNSVNLKKIIGGVKKNKIIFKLKLYQMLCNDKERKNKKILDNAKPKDDLLYYYFLTRNYRFLYDHYYKRNTLFHVNGKNISVNSFPTFDTVLEKRENRFYKNYKGYKREKKIEEFKNASLLAYNNFDGCVEREPKKEKIFFAIRAPKLDDLNKKYNSIINSNKLIETDNILKFKINKKSVKLNENKLCNIKLDENSEENHFSSIKNRSMEDLQINEQTFCFDIKEEKMNQEDNVFPENYFPITPENLSDGNNNENSNGNSFSGFDIGIIEHQKIVNHNRGFHELY